MGLFNSIFKKHKYIYFISFIIKRHGVKIADGSTFIKLDYRFDHDYDLDIIKDSTKDSIIRGDDVELEDSDYIGLVSFNYIGKSRD